MLNRTCSRDDPRTQSAQPHTTPPAQMTRLCGFTARLGVASARAAVVAAAVAALAAFGNVVAAAAGDATARQKPRATMTYYDDVRCASKRHTTVVVTGARVDPREGICARVLPPRTALTMWPRVPRAASSRVRSRPVQRRQHHVVVLAGVLRVHDGVSSSPAAGSGTRPRGSAAPNAIPPHTRYSFAAPASTAASSTARATAARARAATRPGSQMATVGPPARALSRRRLRASAATARRPQAAGARPPPPAPRVPPRASPSAPSRRGWPRAPCSRRRPSTGGGCRVRAAAAAVGAVGVCALECQ